MTSPHCLQPSHRRSRIGYRFARRLWRPGDHDDRNAERLRRYDLGVGSRAARVLRYYGIDMLGFEQAAFAGLVEGATREDEPHVGRQRYVGAGRINQAGDIAMLRSASERTDFEPAEAQKHVAGPLPQGLGGRAGISDVDPMISRLLRPRWPAQRCEGHGSVRASGNRIARNVRRVGMSRVDHCANALLDEPVGKALGTTESANAGRKRLRRWICGAAGERKRRGKACVTRHQARQRGCFRRTAENENAHVPND